MRSWVRLAAVAIGCLVLGLGLAGVLLSIWLHASPQHVNIALRYLLVSGVVSLLLGLSALAITSRFAPSLSIKIAVSSLAGSLAALVNVLVTPLLMFSQRNDKYLLAITLLYFLALSLAFASIVAVYTTGQVRALAEGVRRLADGRFETRVPVRGQDEVAALARTFNRMSADLGTAFERERRMEQERRDLMAGVSHDLRTPLASIRAMIEAINDGVVTESETVRNYLSLIQVEAEYLGRLIDDLFELARIEGGNLDLRLAPVPLSEMVAETVDALQVQARQRGIELQAECSPDVPVLPLDGPRMQRVLINLLQNALSHTPPGGRVDVALLSEDGRVQLAVSDDGKGIAPDDQQHIFDRFYRADKARGRTDDGGAGLGLAIARAIVEAHHGSIGVESTPGKGSRFVVTLGARG